MAIKGIVFTTLGKMVEETFGIEEWNNILATVGATDGGAYVSTEYYEDSELLTIVSLISKEKQIPMNDLVFAYGKYLLKTFSEKYPIFFQGVDLKEFLMSINSVIHVEVKKLHDNTYLPMIDCREISPNKLSMVYQSQRKLCTLAEGLIHGAADYFGKTVQINQTKCMHKGDQSCHLDITIS